MVSRSRRLRYYAIESGQSQAFSAQIFKVFCTFGFLSSIRWFIFTFWGFHCRFSCCFQANRIKIFLKFSRKIFKKSFRESFARVFLEFSIFFNMRNTGFLRPGFQSGKQFRAAFAFSPRFGLPLPLHHPPAALLLALHPRPANKKSGTAACPLPGGAVSDASRDLASCVLRVLLS